MGWLPIVIYVPALAYEQGTYVRDLIKSTTLETKILKWCRAKSLYKLFI